MIVKQRLDLVVYELLIESFYNEEYSAGQILSPADIAEKYAISKTPVLQALKRLENERILEVSHGGKYTLIRPNEENIRDICEIRYLFEQNAVLKVMPLLNGEDYARLYAMSEACRSVSGAADNKEILKADYSFHKYLVSLMGNSIINEFFESIINRYILLKYASGYHNEAQGILEKSYVSHRRITELLQEEKTAELLDFLRQHIYFEA